MLSLFTPWRYTGSSGTAPLILNLNTNGGGWLTSRPGRFTLGKYPDTHWIGGLGGPQNPVSTFWRIEKSVAPAGVGKPTKIFFLNCASDLQIITYQMLPRVTRKGSAGWEFLEWGSWKQWHSIWGSAVPESLGNSNIRYTLSCFKLYRSIIKDISLQTI